MAIIPLTYNIITIIVVDGDVVFVHSEHTANPLMHFQIDIT